MPEVNYIWDELDDTIQLEMDDSKNVNAAYEIEPGRYGEANIQTRNSLTSFIHYNGQGSTSTLTDDNQNVTDTFTYSAFGETVVRTGVTQTLYRFQGKSGYQTDDKTNLLYVRRRQYGPTEGRWRSVDPKRERLFSFHAYRYADNSPLTNTDPSGELCVTPGFGRGDYLGCGTYAWIAFYKPETFDMATYEGNVFLVQKVTWYASYDACDGTNHVRTQKCRSGQPHAVVYGPDDEVPEAEEFITWELFWRRNGKSMQGKPPNETEIDIDEIVAGIPDGFTDSFRGAAPRETCGKRSIRGSAQVFAAGDDPPPGGWDIWEDTTGIPPTDPLLRTCTNPFRADQTLTTERTAERSLSITWDCCGEEEVKEIKHSADPPCS